MKLTDGNIFAMIASCEGDKDHSDLYKAFNYLDTIPDVSLAAHAKYASDTDLFIFLMFFPYYPNKGCREAVEELCKRHNVVYEFDYRTYPQFIVSLYDKYGR